MLWFLLAVSLLVSASVLLGPILITSHHFSEIVRNEVTYGKPHETASAIQSHVRLQAEELDLPIRERDISVEKRGRWCRIEVTYSVPVRIAGRTVWELEFSTVHEGESVPPPIG